jgi:glyoxylase-like metal-dependent hydrolase (beta-lactamase superfamily II)
MTAPIHPIAPDLDLIELRPPLAGFDTFIGAWLYRGDANCLVDVGPAVTAPELLAALAAMGVKHLDAVYLTHIHIDHAGAIGQIADAFPETPIVVHPKGIAHLVDPTRLWAGTLETLADTARAYGPFRPVPEGRLVPAEGPIPGPLEALATPGHAPHHISYLGEAGLFVGEAGGVRLDLPGGEVYMRPATPPRFFPDVYLNSLATVAAQRPQRLLYGHFGMTTDTRLLARHADQIHLWMGSVEAVWRRWGGDVDGDLADRCVDTLLAQDQHLSGFGRLYPAARERERGFLLNSVRGMLGELAARQQA